MDHKKLKAIEYEDSILDYDTISSIHSLNNSHSPEKIIDALVRNYKGNSFIANTIFDLLKTAGLKTEKISDFVKEQLLQQIENCFSAKEIERKLIDCDVLPEWVDKLTEEPSSRNLIFKLYKKYPNSFYLKYSIAKIKAMGYNRNNSHLKFNINKVYDINKFNQFIKTFILNVLSSKRKINAIMSIDSKLNSIRFNSKLNSKLKLELNLELNSDQIKNEFNSRKLDRSGNYFLQNKFLVFCSLVCFSQWSFAFTFEVLNEFKRLFENVENDYFEAILDQIGDILVEYAVEFNKTPQKICLLTRHNDFFNNLKRDKINHFLNFLNGDFNDENINEINNFLFRKIFSKEKIELKKIKAVIKSRKMVKLLAKAIFVKTTFSELTAKKMLFILFFVEEKFSNFQNLIEIFDKNLKNRINFDEIFDKNFENLNKLMAFRKIAISKGFGINFMKNLGEIKLICDNKIGALGLLLVIKSHLCDRDFYVATYQATTTPVFFYFLGRIQEEFSDVRNSVFEIAKKVFLIDFPNSFGAIRRIELFRSVLTLCLCLLQSNLYSKVFDLILSQIDKTDYSLIRFFVDQTIDSISPPYSSLFLMEFLGLILNESVIKGILSENNTKNNVNNFINRIILSGNKIFEMDKVFWKKINDLQKKTKN